MPRHFPKKSVDITKGLNHLVEYFTFMKEGNYVQAMLDGRVGSDAKSKIMAAALEEFGMNSLAAARTRNIAKRAGVNHAAISYYFGGKNGLYEAVARQIVEFIEIYDRRHYELFERVKRNGSAEEAKELIKSILASRMSCEGASGECLRYIIMIIMREEFLNGRVFEMFFKKAFKPVSDMMWKLVEIGSGGKYMGERAHIIAEMLMGQVHLFNNARTGVVRSMSWKCFDRACVRRVGAVSAELIDKILE